MSRRAAIVALLCFSLMLPAGGSAWLVSPWLLADTAQAATQADDTTHAITSAPVPGDCHGAARASSQADQAAVDSVSNPPPSAHHDCCGSDCSCGCVLPGLKLHRFVDSAWPRRNPPATPAITTPPSLYSERLLRPPIS